MKNLIVNADGFGFSEGCNRGIFDTIENGIISSVSVNMNFKSSEETLRLQELYPNISIGVHLNPIVGPPVSPLDTVRSLLNPDTNEFWGGKEFTRRLTFRKIKLKELKLELENQLKKALDMGTKVTHIDSHQNRHLHPFYFKVFLNVGIRFGIKKMRTHNYYLFASKGRSEVYRFYRKNPWRLMVHTINRINMNRASRLGFNMADRSLVFTLLEKGTKSILENWIFVLSNLPEGTSEVYNHPAYPDETLLKYASYVSERELERNLLQEQILKDIIENKNIKLISFKELK